MFFSCNINHTNVIVATFIFLNPYWSPHAQLGNKNMQEANCTATLLLYTSPPRPRSLDTDNEVTAFPRGSNDLAPHQHVLAYLVKSRLIWDPFRQGMLVYLAASIPIQTLKEWGLPWPTFRHFDTWYSVTIWQLASHPLLSRWYGRFTMAKLVLGQVTLWFKCFCISVYSLLSLSQVPWQTNEFYNHSFCTDFNEQENTDYVWFRIALWLLLKKTY